MEKIQYDNDELIVYSPDTLKYITNKMIIPFKTSFEFYKKLFNINSFRKIQVNYFDDIQNFREFIYSIRQEKISLPQYAQGTFDNGMINAYIDPHLDINSKQYQKKLLMASHETFHIMYKELILDKENIERIVWFDEGMAQFFSGEYDNVINEENFQIWLENLLHHTKELPNLNQLNHGRGFETEKYSGYKLSLLAVKYLFDKLGIEKFKSLMHNTKKIKKYGDTVLQDAISFYKK